MKKSAGISSVSGFDAEDLTKTEDGTSPGLSLRLENLEPLNSGRCTVYNLEMLHSLHWICVARYCGNQLLLLSKNLIKSEFLWCRLLLPSGLTIVFVCEYAK